MTSAEVMRMLETLRARYTPEVAVLDPEVVRLWKDQFLQAHRDHMLPAVKEYLAEHPASEPFPKPAQVRWYLRKHQEAAETIPGGSQSKPAAAPQGPAEPCGCDRGWKTSTVEETAVASRPTHDPGTGRLDGPTETYTVTYPPGVYPCPQHNRAGYDRWHNQWVPEAIRMRPIKSTDLIDYDPRVVLAEARALIPSTISTLTKDPNDL